MKTIVVYASKTGFAKKYAKWIAEDLSADICEASKANTDMLMAYDTVIYGGGLYAVGINGVKMITQNLDKLKDKNIVVFATGATPARQETIDEIKNKNFSLKQQEQLRFFYLRGGFNYSRLKLFDKLLINLLKLKIKRKKERTLDEKGMLAAYENPVDFTRKRNIDQIISYINSGVTNDLKK